MIWTFQNRDASLIKNKLPTYRFNFDQRSAVKVAANLPHGTAKAPLLTGPSNLASSSGGHDVMESKYHLEVMDCAWKWGPLWWGPNLHIQPKKKVHDFKLRIKERMALMVINNTRKSVWTLHCVWKYIISMPELEPIISMKSWWRAKQWFLLPLLILLICDYKCYIHLFLLYHMGVSKRDSLPKIGVPQNGWLIMENLIKMDDLGAPLFSETSIFSPLHLHNIHTYWPSVFQQNPFETTNKPFRLSPCLHDSDRDPRKRHEIRHRYGSPSPGHPWAVRGAFSQSHPWPLYGLYG